MKHKFKHETRQTEMCLNNRCLQTQGEMEKKDAEASQPVNLSFPLPDIPAHLGRFAHDQTTTT